MNRHRHGWGFDEYFLTFLLFANQETEMPQRPPSSYLTEFDLLWALDALFYWMPEYSAISKKGHLSLSTNNEIWETAKSVSRIVDWNLVFWRRTTSEIFYFTFVESTAPQCSLTLTMLWNSIFVLGKLVFCHSNIFSTYEISNIAIYKWKTVEYMGGYHRRQTFGRDKQAVIHSDKCRFLVNIPCWCSREPN